MGKEREREREERKRECVCVDVLYPIFFFFFRVPQLYLWGSPVWVVFFAYMTIFFSPTIEVVTFRLRGNYAPFERERERES